MTSAAIVQKLWNYCNVLRDDGMSDLKIVQSSEFIVQSYGKSRNGDRCGMADERRSPPCNQPMNRRFPLPSAAGSVLCQQEKQEDEER